jgi:hypothetical protein
MTDSDRYYNLRGTGSGSISLNVGIRRLRPLETDPGLKVVHSTLQSESQSPEDTVDFEVNSAPILHSNEEEDTYDLEVEPV